MQVGPLRTSGRVIATGRLLFAALFLVAVWADDNQPARAQQTAYVLLIAYVAWALALTAVVWNNWWQDARLAAAAHVIDVAVFMVMLYSTEGYTSPYFTFFIFILLAAAIRWGWQETAITALAIVAVYFSVGLMLAPVEQLEVGRFIIRAGHLLIISSILVWFGANQWIAWPRLGIPAGGPAAVSGDPFVAALRAAMELVGARRGAMLWMETGDEELQLAEASGEGESRAVAAAAAAPPDLPANLLFDLRRDRALVRSDAGRWRFLSAEQALPPLVRDHCRAGPGLVIPVSAGAIKAVVVFQQVRALSTDHLEVAPRVAREVAAGLQEAALFAAVEERSMAKARIAVARDLHDSIVQFLAGLGFRLEALIRSPAKAMDQAAGLAELKDMVLTEQRQMRAFIRGLKAGKPISVDELSRDCASLCQLLARQWNIACEFTSEAEPGWVMLRTQLDVQQLIREAVANAVRHGAARQVSVSLAGDQERLRLTVADDGRGFAPPAAGKAIAPPASLSARVREARGELEVRSRAGATAIVVHLPVGMAA